MEGYFNGHFIHGLMVLYYRVNRASNQEAIKSTQYEF